jgi:hypothetical protein
VHPSSSEHLAYVVNVRTDNDLEEIQELLKDVEGITIRQVGDHVILDGNAYSREAGRMSRA